MQSQAVMQRKSAAAAAAGLSFRAQHTKQIRFFMTRDMPTLIKPTPHKLELERAKICQASSLFSFNN